MMTRSTSRTTRGTAAGANVSSVDHHAAAFEMPLRAVGHRIHHIGIGGCGVSGLARLLHQRGGACSGSDSTPGELTDLLLAEGIRVEFDQSGNGIPDDCDLVIASAAIRSDNPELLSAQRRGLPVLSYAQALGLIQADHTGVSIAGTHGKSTTTAMLCHVLIECDLDPSFIVGATCPQIGGGSRTGSMSIPRGPLAGFPGILVAEACEFNRSFHHHRPRLALINNVEEDHLDVYGTLGEVVRAFAEFAQLIPSADDGGRLLIAHDGAHRREIAAGLTCRVETFGFSPAADWQVIADPASGRVGLLQHGALLSQWKMAMPGEHNALNSAAAAVIAQWLGGEWEAIAAALSRFRGIERRMQRLGIRSLNRGGEVVVYDDYGHHPTEIDTTLRALRAAEKPQRLICVFQPHQHSRTRFLLDQFAQSFSSADVVIVPHIYFVRDSEIERTRVCAADLVERLQQRGVVAIHIDSFDSIVEHLGVACRPGDLVVIMGAGPVWQIGRQFLDRGGPGSASSTTQATEPAHNI